ncbi:MAG: thrombospondin type 3 repeat-containing protein [Acidobacteria bacterium]|nr:thrombospondin type 3 repeat-containing protein [Acidobacteriota bacterium]
MKRAFMALVLLAGTCLPALADYNVSGRFVYVDREFDANGFTGIEPQRPIRFAAVQVVEGTKIVGSGVTDGAGNFVFGVPDTRTRDIYIRCLARRQTSTAVPVDVRSGSQVNDIWSIRTQTYTNHGPTQDVFIGTLAAEPGAGGEAFNLYDSAILGSDYLVSMRGSGTYPLLIVVFNAANPNLSSFNPSNDTITQARNAGYDDTVMLHEMGHYVVYNFSGTDSPNGAHHLSDCNQNLMLAFDEGHATFFGLSARRFASLPHASTYVRTTGLPGPGNLQFYFDAETQLPFVCRGASSETTVYAALWDIGDGPATTDETAGIEEAWDLLQGLDAEYWRAMTTYLPGAVNISLEDFWDSWFHPSVNNGWFAEMKGAFRELGVEYFVDAFELNDTVGEARLLSPGGGLNHATFFADRNNDLLGEPDPDLFAFDAIAGTSYAIETLSLLGDANTSLTLLASDGSTVLASNDDRSLSDASSLILYTPASTGRLYVRSVHAPDFGIYGSYDLRIAASSGGIDNDADGYSTDTDCNDNDPLVHPGATERCNGYDDNCDTLVDEGFDRDGDGFTTCNGDCNDGNAQIHPGVPEICNSADDNCNGVVDEGFDADADGYTACGGDCNDANPLINPGRAETCNGIDDNCNLTIDEGFDADGDGYTTCGGDCNDADPLVSPGRAEVCNGLDDNCNLAVDEGFPDTDGDGLKDCVDPDDDNDGVLDAADCAPVLYSVASPPGEALNLVVTGPSSSSLLIWEQVAEANIYNVYRGLVPIAGWAFQSVCLMSESADLRLTEAQSPPAGYFYYYLQAAKNVCGEGTLGTGTGGEARPIAVACEAQNRDTDGDLVLDITDNCPLVANASQADQDRDGRGESCDNCLATYNPDQRDRDGNGLGDACQDSDSDGYFADVDCDDTDPAIHPGATEICNTRDDDCDGLTDEGFGTGVVCSDGIGACLRTGTIVCVSPTSTACSVVAGSPTTEFCNGADDDCDGSVDEGFDQDGDGYTTCAGDCNDAVASIHPSAVEVFNGVDDDCNNIIDDVVEVITIPLAAYRISNSTLTVEATTNYPLGSVTLSVQGYGVMTWVPSAGVYRLIVSPTTNPGTVTVVSTAGGSATSAVTLQ